MTVLEPGIEDPALGARLGIEGEDAHEGRAVVEMIVDDERRDLQRGHLRIARAVVEIAAAMGPGDLQGADVGAVDLVEGRVVDCAGRSAPDGPLRGRSIETDLEVRILTAADEGRQQESDRREDHEPGGRSDGGSRDTKDDEHGTIRATRRQRRNPPDDIHAPSPRPTITERRPRARRFGLVEASEIV